MKITHLLGALALAGSLAAADSTGGTAAGGTATDNANGTAATATDGATGADTGATVGSGSANASSGAAQNAGGKAGTETGAGRGNDLGAGAAKAGGNTAQLKLDALPADVKSAVTREASAQEITNIRQATRDGKSVYEVNLDRGGKHEVVTFDQAGKKLDSRDAESAR